jgi:hypothetical protein
MNLTEIIAVNEDERYYIVIAKGTSLNENIEFQGSRCRVLRLSSYVRNGDMFKLQLLKLDVK